MVSCRRHSASQSKVPRRRGSSAAGSEGSRGSGAAAACERGALGSSDCREPFDDGGLGSRRTAASSGAAAATRAVAVAVLPSMAAGPAVSARSRTSRASRRRARPLRAAATSIPGSARWALRCQLRIVLGAKSMPLALRPEQNWACVRADLSKAVRSRFRSAAVKNRRLMSSRLGPRRGEGWRASRPRPRSPRLRA